MQLILLALLAGIVGYWLARSKYRENIDQTAEQVSNTSRDAVNQVGGWFRSLFGGKKQPADDVVDAEFEEDDTPEEVKDESDNVKPAEKSTSRRKRATQKEE